jgi:hypothetical protein
MSGRVLCSAGAEAHLLNWLSCVTFATDRTAVGQSSIGVKLCRTAHEDARYPVFATFEKIMSAEKKSKSRKSARPSIRVKIEQPHRKARVGRIYVLQSEKRSRPW